VLLLPFDNARQQPLRFDLVTDKIVVDEETALESLSQHRIKLREDLFRSFDSRPPAEDRDDVAELTQKRTAARELHRGRTVAAALQQIEAGHGHARHVCLLLLFVTRCRWHIRGECVKENRPGFFGFTDKAHVA
jgi:hypothetical protein